MINEGRLERFDSWEQISQLSQEIRKFSFANPVPTDRADDEHAAQRRVQMERNHDAEEDLHRHVGDLSLYRASRELLTMQRFESNTLQFSTSSLLACETCSLPLAVQLLAHFVQLSPTTGSSGGLEVSQASMAST